MKEHKWLLNPSKVYIAVTKCTVMGFENDLIGQKVSDHYLNARILQAEPKTPKEKDNFQGTTGYISNHIYGNAMLQYWLRQMDKHQEGKPTN